MAITQPTFRSDPFTSSDPWTLGASIDVQPSDLIVSIAQVRNTGTTNLLNALPTKASGTATIETFQNLVQMVPPSGFLAEVRVDYTKVTSGGTVVGQIDPNGTRSGRLLWAVFRGVDPDNPIIGAASTARGTSTSPAAAALTPEQAGDAIVSGVAKYGNVTYTGSSGFTTIVNAVNDENLLAEWRLTPDANPIAAAPTMSPSDAWATFNLLLRAAPEVVPGTVISRGSFF